MPPHFWGERIYNATAFVGDNGGGKTTIMQYLILLLADLERNLRANRHAREDWILVFQHKGEIAALQNHSVLTFEEAPALRADEGIACFRCDQLPLPGDRKGTALEWLEDQLHRTKVLYHSNVLNRADETLGAEWLNSCPGTYTQSFLYDSSLYARMLRCAQTGLDSGSAAAFLAQEQKRELDYVASLEQQSFLNNLWARAYPIPVPQQLQVRIRESEFFLPEDRENPSEDLNQMFRRMFRQSWKNTQTPVSETEGRGERFLFELCYGAVCSYLNWLLSYLPVYEIQEDGINPSFIVSHILDLLQPVETPPSEETGVLCAEFTDMLDQIFDIVQRFASSRIDPCCLETANKRKNEYLAYIEFLCRKKSRQAIQRYLPLENPRVVSLDNALPNTLVIPLSSELRQKEEHDTVPWFLAFYHKYIAACYNAHYLDFEWGLSSGEENLLRMFACFEEVYGENFLSKASICNFLPDFQGGRDAGKTVCCENLWIFLDEADLTYHPEWQRRFMSILTEVLPNIYPADICREMQIFLSTHSPLMLGDFPSRSVVYLRHRKDEGKTVDDSGKIQTFGENLFDLLHNSFYLQNGEIGGLAQHKIQGALHFLGQTKQELQGSPLDSTAAKTRLESLQFHRMETIALLADGIIKHKLQQEYRELEALLEQYLPVEEQHRLRRKRIEALELELDQLYAQEDAP